MRKTSAQRAEWVKRRLALLMIRTLGLQCKDIQFEISPVRYTRVLRIAYCIALASSRSFHANPASTLNRVISHVSHHSETQNGTPLSQPEHNYETIHTIQGKEVSVHDTFLASMHDFHGFNFAPNPINGSPGLYRPFGLSEL